MASKNIDVRQGVENKKIINATEEYDSFTEHENILECNTKVIFLTKSKKYIQRISVLYFSPRFLELISLKNTLIFQ